MFGAVPVRRYIVAATPRTGSNLLCEGLEATGVAGRPEEFFAPHFREHWCRRWKIGADASFQQYYYAAIIYGTTGNGTFGFRIHQMHLRALAESASFFGDGFGRGITDVLDYLFPTSLFIRTVRSDRLAQAISYYRALATNEWVRRATWEEQEQDFHLPPNVVGPLPFEPAAIRALVADLSQQAEAWDDYLARRGIVPMVIEYESLVERYRETIAQVLEFLGLPAQAAANIPPPRSVRQADELTRCWRSRLDAGDRAEAAG